MYDSVIKVTTNDAYSLTEGPTIFLTQDVKKTAMFYLRVSNIPEDELDKILQIMSENEEYMLELEEVEKEEQAGAKELAAHEPHAEASRFLGRPRPSSRCRRWPRRILL